MVQFNASTIRHWVIETGGWRLEQVWPGGKVRGVQQSTWKSGGNDLQEQFADFHIDFAWQSREYMALQLFKCELVACVDHVTVGRAKMARNSRTDGKYH